LRAQTLTSQAERAKLYRQAEQMLHDDVGRLFIANNQPPLAFARTVKGYVPTRPAPSTSTSSRSSKEWPGPRGRTDEAVRHPAQPDGHPGPPRGLRPRLRLRPPDPRGSGAHDAGRAGDTREGRRDPRTPRARSADSRAVPDLR